MLSLACEPVAVVAEFEDVSPENPETEELPESGSENFIAEYVGLKVRRKKISITGSRSFFIYS